MRPNSTLVRPVVGAGLLVALVALVSFRALRQVETAAEARKETYTLILDGYRLLSEMKDAETGERGYLLTGDEAYLAPYLAVRGSVNDHLAALRRLTLLTTAQQHLDTLTPLVAAKLGELAQVIDLRRHHDLPAALAVIASGRGKHLMDAIRAQVGDFLQHEDGALVQHEA